MTTSISELTPLPLIGYVRVSRVGARVEGEGYISKAEQRRTIERLARDRGVKLAGIYEEENVSGGSLEGRHQLHRIMEAVTGRQAGGIVVATFDRFSRDTGDFLDTAGELTAAGGRIICGDGDVDLSNGTGKAMATMRAVWATMEKDRKREYMEGTMRNKIEAGVHLAIPFGYERGNGPGKPLTINGYEAEVVQLAFSLRAEGHSWKAIARQLNETGVMPRPKRIRGKGGLPDRWHQAKWSHTRVARMCQQKVYLGVAHSGAHRTEGAHPAIVSRELWAKANASQGAAFKATGTEWLLTGLVRCHGCGHTMVRRYQLSAGRKLWYYQCVQADCEAPAACRLLDLEQWVVAQFLREFVHVEVEALPDTSEVDEALARVTERRSERDNALRNMMLLDPDNAGQIKAAQGIVQGAEAALQLAEAALLRARAAANRVSLPADFTADAFDTLEVGEQRHLLSTVYACIVVRRGERGAPLAGRVGRQLRADELATDRLSLVALAQAFDGWHPTGAGVPSRQDAGVGPGEVIV